jgi:ATP-dependent helicase/DNAse subunit B
VPLKLVTGPANAAKAGEVLGGLRERLPEEPILVVPAFQDVEHSQRELAARGAIFGAEVVRFSRLVGRIAERAGYGEPVASAVQQELVMEEAVRRAGLEVLAASAAQPGFARAALRFARELETNMVEPARFTQALRAWAADGPRRAYAEEIAAVYRGYGAALSAAGLVDEELYAWRALDALRRAPERWGATPVFVYGFDDFDRLQRDALETLSDRCGADVVVSLPFEPGREAFRAVAETHAHLTELATERVALPALDDHYAEGSRAALHHLERGLYSAEAPGRVPAGGAVKLHSAGGERAEVELVGAEVLALLRERTPPGEVAVVLSDPSRYASLIEQVFGAYGIPFSIDRSLPFRHTALGRGLLALLRCARLGGSAEDLLAWLRTPGKLDGPHLADRLESELRQAGATTAVEARAVWERERWPLDELERLGGAGSAPELLGELDRALERLFAGPHRREAPVLSGPELDDARAFDAARRALGALADVVAADPGVALDAQRVHGTLAALSVRVGENPQPDRVQVASPQEVRARRFQAVFVCGLSEGEFPSGGSTDPFLPDEDRRALATASGLALPLREDRLERERYLFYVCASRAERLLVLSSRYCNEEGDPEGESFFVEDVRELFEELPVRRRALSDVTWEPDEAPTSVELERSLAARGPRADEVVPERLGSHALLAELAAREAVAAGALEKYADCPVKWLVESLLRPEALEPDPEQMVRGLYAHKVLEQTFARLREETGERRVTPETLPAAERILLEELEAHRGEFRLSPNQTRVRAAVRRLEFDLLRFLRWEAEADSRFEPEHLELEFGLSDEPVQVAEGVSVRGKVDRVDVWNGQAVVRDYKTSKSADNYKLSSWEGENRFQAALYMLAVRERLGLEPVAGLYEPLGSSARRPRGMVADDVPELGSGYVKTDVVDRERFEEVLEQARERIAATAARMRAGELGCNPDSCAFDGGCAYPSICRTED